MPDAEYPTNAGKYVCKNYHRNGNPEKSQWTITEEKEINIFERVFEDDIPSDKGFLWGFDRTANSSFSKLGVSALSEGRPQRILKLAKFVQSTNPASWAGYPADYRTKPGDRPTPDVLQRWHKSGVILKHEINKIRTGKPCNLSK